MGVKNRDEALLEGGLGGSGGGGGGGGGRSFPQAINTVTPANERALIAERELAANRALEKARVQDAKDYAERKASGEIKSSFNRPDKAGMKSGGKVRSASSRADGIAQRGKTRGKIY